MVTTALRHAVVQASVFKEDPADDAELRQQPYRAKNGRPPGAAAAVEQVIGGEVGVLLQDSRDYGTTRWRHPVSPGFELEANGFEIGHDTWSQ